MLHIVFNPVAGKKRATKNLAIAERIFSERNIPYEVHATAAAGDGEKIVRELSEQGETQFVVIGGDGTLHEALNGLSDPTVCTLGLIPSGTGNDFAEALGIPLDGEKAALKIAEGAPSVVDYMQIGHRRSMNVAGLGMDVDVLERCLRGKSKGKLKYLKSLLSSLFKFKGYKIRIESDGQVQTRDALIAAVCNGSLFGGGIKICPPAKEDDGLMDIILVDCIGGAWKIILAFIQLMKGKIIEYPLTTYFRCEKVEFIPDEAAPIQLDGEVYHNHAFEAKICKGLKFY